MARISCFLLCVALGWLSGCRTLPDTQAFTGATAGLRAAVAATGTTVVAELKQTPLPGVAAQASQLDKAWAARNDAMSAVVEYSNSLQAIVDSGKKGGESAKKLADAVGTLAGALKVANPVAGTAGELAADTFEFVYSQIAVARAAKSLEAALTAIQPAIDRMAQLIAADLRRCDEIMTLATRAERDALADANQSELAYRKQLLKSRGQAMASMASELESGTKPAELAKAEDLTRLTDLLAKNDAWYAGYEQKQAAIAARGRAAHELIGAASAAVPDWAAAHAQMLGVVSARRAPTVTELTDAVARVRELVDRYQKL